jgi:hypothetical protein
MAKQTPKHSIQKSSGGALSRRTRADVPADTTYLRGYLEGYAQAREDSRQWGVLWHEYENYHRDIREILTIAAAVGLALHNNIIHDGAKAMLGWPTAKLDETLGALMIGFIRCTRAFQHYGYKVSFDLTEHRRVYHLCKDAINAIQAFVVEDDPLPLKNWALSHQRNKPMHSAILDIDRGGPGEEEAITTLCERARPYRETGLKWPQVAERITADLESSPLRAADRLWWETWRYQGTEIENLRRAYRRREKKRTQLVKSYDLSEE